MTPNLPDEETGSPDRHPGHMRPQKTLTLRVVWRAVTRVEPEAPQGAGLPLMVTFGLLPLNSYTPSGREILKWPLLAVATWNLLPCASTAVIVPGTGPGRSGDPPVIVPVTVP